MGLWRVFHSWDRVLIDAERVAGLSEESWQILMKKKHFMKHPKLFESGDIHVNNYQSSSKFVFMETFSQESHTSTWCFSLLLSPPMPTSLPPPAPQPSESKPFRGCLPGCLPPRPSVKMLYAIWVGFPGASENRYNDSGIHKHILSVPLLDLSKKVSCPGLHAEESPTYHKHTHKVIWNTSVPLCWNLVLNM